MDNKQFTVNGKKVTLYLGAEDSRPMSPQDTLCTGGADEYLKLLLSDILLHHSTTSG